MPVKRLKNFLDENHTQYVSIKHSTAYTASEVAQSAHIPGDDLAKTVVVKFDGKMGLVVLPSTEEIDWDLLKEKTNAKKAELAEEDEFKKKFPDCEIGAMPPFGNLYEMDVYVAQSLESYEDIAFNAGTHKEVIKMAFTDFDSLVQPTMIKCTIESSKHQEVKID